MKEMDIIDKLPTATFDFWSKDIHQQTNFTCMWNSKIDNWGKNDEALLTWK